MRRLPAFHPPVLLISSFLFLPDTFMFLHTNLEDWLFLTSTSWSVILYTRGELFDAFSLSARLLHFVQSSLYAKSYLMHSLCLRGFSILFSHLCMYVQSYLMHSLCPRGFSILFSRLCMYVQSYLMHSLCPRGFSILFSHLCMYWAIWCILSVHAAFPKNYRLFTPHPASLHLSWPDSDQRQIHPGRWFTGREKSVLALSPG